jgi:hypothetical protein
MIEGNILLSINRLLYEKDTGPNCKDSFILYKNGEIRVYGEENSRINVKMLFSEIEKNQDNKFYLGPHYGSEEIMEAAAKMLNILSYGNEIGTKYRFAVIEIEEGVFAIEGIKTRFSEVFHA